MNLHDLVPTSHDAMPLVRWFFWSTAASVALRSLAKGFGPLVLEYSPKLYKLLGLIGNGVLVVISDMQGLAEMFRPKPSEPPKPPVPPMAVLMVMALVLGGCPTIPSPDNCRPSSFRCHGDRPQVCSQTGRWTNADRPCSEVGATCCMTLNAGGEVFVYACVPQDRCVFNELGDAGVEQ